MPLAHPLTNIVLPLHHSRSKRSSWNRIPKHPQRESLSVRSKVPWRRISGTCAAVPFIL